MSVRRSIRSERGGILVLSAVTIPVFLLLTALVIDTGNWFTHKRQLQNRADAGALAAGLELAKRWPGCVTDPTSEAVITSVAKRFAGNPSDATAVNTEIATQTKFNVQVNSTTYTGPDFSDKVGNTGQPCQVHPANPAPESEANITPPGGTWVDVKVREIDTNSLFGSFGLNLLSNQARARVELNEAYATDQFMPLAIPEEEIVKARIRFVNACNGSEIGTGAPLKPLQAAYQTASGMQLWGPDPTDANTSVAPGTMALALPGTVPVPGTTTCANDGQLDYTPVNVELRIAGRNDINLTAPTCAVLQAMTSADCYPKISQIRVYQDAGGLFGDRPQIRDVQFSPSGARPCNMDVYYARTTATPNCLFDATVFMDWGGRPIANATFEANISVDGSTAAPMAGPTPQGNWTAAQVPISTLGPNTVRVTWRYELTAGSWGPGGLLGCTDKNNNPCVQQGTTAIHQSNLGDDPSGNVDPPSDSVSAVKLTSGPSITSSEVHSGHVNQTITPYVTIGFGGAFKPGDFAILRLRSGQRNFSVVCDPYWDQPSSVDTMAAFYYGCQPPYAANDTTTNSFWWNTSTSSCPAASSWFSYSGTPPDVSYPQSPWRCVQLDVGGNGFSVGDGIALATGNCGSPSIDPIGPGSKATCQGGGPNAYQCNNGIIYQGGTNYPPLDSPRVIKIFIVPFGAYKNVQSGNGQIVPVLRLAAFYVTAWKFNKGVDPCGAGQGGGTFGNENARIAGEQVGGYFIKAVDSSGTANPQKQCVPDDINICVVSLTR